MFNFEKKKYFSLKSIPTLGEMTSIFQYGYCKINWSSKERSNHLKDWYGSHTCLYVVGGADMWDGGGVDGVVGVAAAAVVLLGPALLLA